MQVDGIPTWVWLLFVVTRLLAGAAFRVFTAVSHRRATGVWPPLAGCRCAAQPTAPTAGRD